MSSIVYNICEQHLIILIPVTVVQSVRKFLEFTDEFSLLFGLCFKSALCAYAIDRELTSVMGAVAYVCCVLLVLFASVSIHRVSHFINATMMTVALPSAMIVMFRGRSRTTPAADSDKKTQ